MKVVVTGASGLVGSALVPALESAGHEVIRLVRRTTRAKNERQWWPMGDPDPALVDGADAVVHLASETIKGWWTTGKKERILQSRVRGTEMIAKSIAMAEHKPKVFVSASGTGYYGHRKDEVLTEESGSGRGFLAELARDWERAARPAEQAGVRTVLLRISLVLSGRGGALQALLPSFRMGMGGPVSNGKQYWPWITLDDIVRVILFAIENDSLRGPVNVCAPQHTTNREFTRALGKVLRRPAIFPLPGVVITLVLGEMGQEALLTSTRAEPQKLKAAGFPFKHTEIQEALASVLQPVQRSAR
ncbi:MAG TPA: TIGR01777 family oxidoreductase [Terriglobales bacterium]|nr:TIGR01777 family oxidoreductase [Terriglobales bacterium]